MTIAASVQQYFGKPTVSDKLRSIAYQLLVGGALFIGMGVFFSFHNDLSYWYAYILISLFGVMFCIAGETMLIRGEKAIPANPASIGILKIWGKFIPVLVPAGKVMTANYWPFYIDYVAIGIGPRDLDFSYEHILCAPSKDMDCDTDDNPKTKESNTIGAQVKIRVSLKVRPNINDANLLIKFLENGGMANVTTFLKDIVATHVANTAIKYDWLTLKGLKTALSVFLINDLVQLNFQRLPADSDGLVRKDILQISAEDYHNLTDPIDPQIYLMPGKDGTTPDDTSNEHKKRDQETSVFTRVINNSPEPDQKGLGITIAQLLVPEIVLEGGLEDAANAAAKEHMERTKEKLDFITFIELVDILIDAAKSRGEELPRAQASEQALILRGNITKTVIGGDAGDVTKGAALYSASNSRK